MTVTSEDRESTQWKIYGERLVDEYPVEHRFSPAGGREGRSTTSSPPSMTAHASGCGSMTSSTRRPPSSSWTRCWTSCHSGRGDPDRQRIRISDGVPLAPGRPRHPAHLHQACSRARSNGPNASTVKSSTASSRASSSTTPNCSTSAYQEWQDFYNYHLPRGALGGQTRYERLLQKATATTPE